MQDDCWRYVETETTNYIPTIHQRIIPTISYASLIWWHKAKNKVEIRKLKLRELAHLGITEVLTTAPKVAIEEMLDLPALYLEVGSIQTQHRQ